MKPELMKKFKAMFENQKKSLLYSGKLVNDSFELPKDDILDDVDLSTTELEQSMRLRLRNREALYLRKINEALERIQAGTFGECEECGEEIDPRRLEARPTATHCIECKEAQEKSELLHIDGHRPKSVGSRIRLA